MVELYTDGSCKKVKGEWVYRIGWGFVAVENDIKLHESYGRLCGPADLMAQRNVAGEMKAVLNAVKWASQEHEEFKIYYDYKGVYNWALGYWVARNEYTEAYSEYIQSKMKKHIIHWEHVRGHSGNKWNEYADGLAKNNTVGSTRRRCRG